MVAAKLKEGAAAAAAVAFSVVVSSGRLAGRTSKDQEALLFSEWFATGLPSHLLS